jgi:hypothetical protein
MADGHRNWRLTNPEDTSPGKVKVMTLIAHRAKVGFIDHRLALDILFSASTADPDASGATGRRLSTQLDFSGSYKDAKFTGQALTSDVLSFQETGKSLARTIRDGRDPNQSTTRRRCLEAFAIDARFA